MGMIKCRFCNHGMDLPVVNLGVSPLANSFLEINDLDKKENFFPLKLYFCKNCFLLQLDDIERPENIFSDYVYFSSYSKMWLEHAKNLVHELIENYSINSSQQVIEIASNDGYLLQFFKEKEIPVLGIEPASNIAKIANEKGIPTFNDFFNKESAERILKEYKSADILIAINVLPHVPDLHSFVSGIKKILKSDGICIIQFSAYLLPFIKNIMFDSIYHEHYSYFSLITLQKIFSYYDLEIFNVEEKSIHGGSLRIFLKHKKNSKIIVKDNVKNQIQKEIDFKLTEILTYQNFAKRIIKKKLDIWNFFNKAFEEKKKIVCYGAPAKGNTLLNYCGIAADMIEYTVDISPFKQGKFLPGTHIIIKDPSEIMKTKPDYLIILAWNLQEEVMEQMKIIEQWHGKFVVLLPEVKIFQ